jgi:hypothetical protein
MTFPELLRVPLGSPVQVRVMAKNKITVAFEARGTLVGWYDVADRTEGGKTGRKGGFVTLSVADAARAAVLWPRSSGSWLKNLDGQASRTPFFAAGMISVTVDPADPT